MKQLRTSTVKILLLDGNVARFIEAHGRWQWVIGIEAKPCSVAIKALVGKGWLWINETSVDNVVHAGLNKIGTTRVKLGY